MSAHHVFLVDFVLYATDAEGGTGGGIDFVVEFLDFAKGTEMCLDLLGSDDW